MPMLNVFRCGVCGAQSEPDQGPPRGWITLSSSDGGDVFDKWECIVIYAEGKVTDAKPQP